MIIPTYQEQSQIADAVASAIEASASEILVVDGGSTDETVSIAESLGVTVLLSDPGRAIQQNSGAMASNGDVLLFLHADCRLHRDSLSHIRTMLAEQPAVIGGCFRQRIQDDQLRFRIIEAGNAWRAKVMKWIYGDQGFFVRREAFEELGRFPEWPFLEDWALTRRMKRHGRLVLLKPQLQVSARRWQQVGVLRQTLRNWAILSAACLGVSPAWLAKFYPRAR